jgi:hypothetical protein
VKTALLTPIYTVLTVILLGVAFWITYAVGYHSPTTGLLVLSWLWIALPIAVFLFEKALRNRPSPVAPKPPPNESIVTNLLDALRQGVQGSKLGSGLAIEESNLSRGPCRPAA